MSDQAPLQLTQDSPEYIAFKLMQLIAKSEEIQLTYAQPNCDRQWILNTYKECIQVVRHG